VSNLSDVIDWRTQDEKYHRRPAPAKERRECPECGAVLYSNRRRYCDSICQRRYQRRVYRERKKAEANAQRD
jgi:hypothetical protein